MEEDDDNGLDSFFGSVKASHSADEADVDVNATSASLFEEDNEVEAKTPPTAENAPAFVDPFFDDLLDGPSHTQPAAVITPAIDLDDVFTEQPPAGGEKETSNQKNSLTFSLALIDESGGDVDATDKPTADFLDLFDGSTVSVSQPSVGEGFCSS